MEHRYSTFSSLLYSERKNKETGLRTTSLQMKNIEEKLRSTGSCLCNHFYKTTIMVACYFVRKRPLFTGRTIWSLIKLLRAVQYIRYSTGYDLRGFLHSGLVILNQTSLSRTTIKSFLCSYVFSILCSNVNKITKVCYVYL